MVNLKYDHAPTMFPKLKKKLATNNIPTTTKSATTTNGSAEAIIPFNPTLTCPDPVTNYMPLNTIQWKSTSHKRIQDIKF